MRRALALLILLCLAGGAAGAQVRGPRLRPMIGFQARTRWVPFLGARYSSVQGISGSVLLLRTRAGNGQVYRGPFAAAEGGIHGVSASVGEGGWAAVSGSSLRATFLRTYGSGGRLAGAQSFVGGELRISMRWWTLGGGWYRRIRGSAPGDRSTFAFTAGLGY